MPKKAAREGCFFDIYLVDVIVRYANDPGLLQTLERLTTF